jgi:hypothetical protein
MINMLIKLVEDKNLSYEDIAKLMTAEFGMPFTKNSCIGKGRRIGLAVRAPKAFHMGPIQPQLLVRKKGEPVTIEQLRYGDCRWPLGNTADRPPYMYCGKPAASPGCSWCREHAKKVFSRTSDSAKIYLPA